MSTPLAVPDLVRRRALANGAAGQQWLDDLPDVVADLAQRWDLQIGAAYAGGTASFVTAATDGTGRSCVLKVAMPLDMDEVEAFTRSVVVHQLVDGRGCAALIAHSDSPPAMLLEALGPNLHELGMPLPETIETIVATMRSFWQPAPDDRRLPTAVAKAEWLAAYIAATWSDLGRPCDRSVIGRAIDYCDSRAAAFDANKAIVIHGDAHGWNTLSAGEGRFKFVDPEGVRSEPAHDLSVPMREYNEPLLDGDTSRLVRARAELLSSMCDTDPEAVWEWGFIERVSTGLANYRDFGGEQGGIFLEVARRCL